MIYYLVVDKMGHVMSEHTTKEDAESACPPYCRIQEFETEPLILDGGEDLQETDLPW